MRTEIVWFLKEKSANMIFIDDINLNALHDQQKLEIVLVDHHRLRSKFDYNVVEIIDHHYAEKNSLLLKEYHP